MAPRPSVPRALAGVAAGLTAAVGAAVGVVPAAGAPTPEPTVATTAEPEEYDAPLRISIDALTPGVLPRSGPVVVEGTVTNDDVVPWRNVQLYPFVNGASCPGCPGAITSREGLAEAAETDPGQLVGNRLTSVSDSIRVLRPGESASYSLRVQRSELGVSEPGVYWFGVHASGESRETPRDTFADGRARTFLPYLPQSVRGAVKTAVVVPIRQRVAHTAAGAVSRPEDWERDLSSSGSLGRPLAFGAAATGRPVSWLVDPAVLDSVRRLARGNPPRSVGPTTEQPEDGATVTPSGEPTEDDSEPPEAEDLPRPGPGQAAAEQWLEDLRGQLQSEEILTLPYGDLDIPAAAEYEPELYETARSRESPVLTDWGFPTTPALASPSGYLDANGFDVADDDALALLSDRAFGAEEFPSGAPGVAEIDDHTVAVTSYGASTGGPGPDPRLSPVALRQRLLSEAAVRMLEGGRRAPLVVVLPAELDAEGADQFWTGLDAPWIDLTTVEDAVGDTGRTVDADDLTYPASQEDFELDATIFNELDALLESGRTFQNLLTENTTIADQVTQEGLSGVSYSVRADPTVGVEVLARSRAWIERRQRAIGISAPPGVTLSSAMGSFSVTVTNPLTEPVTVRIEATTDRGAIVNSGDPVVLGPESRTTVVLDAQTNRPGVHNVRLVLTDVDGTPLGATAQIPVRSGQVGTVIWLIIGTGVGVLFVAIAIRLYRRFRRQEPDGGDGGDPDEGGDAPGDGPAGAVPEPEGSDVAAEKTGSTP